MLSNKDIETDETVYRGLFVASGVPKKIPDLLRDKMSISHVGLISDERPDYPVDDYIFYRDCVFGFFDEIDIKLEMKLDKNLLASMSKCETLYFQMMERFEYWGGITIYEHRVNLYHKQLNFWYNYLTSREINLCVFMTIPHFGFDYVIYCLCKLVGIEVIMFHRIPILLNKVTGLYVFSDLDDQMKGLKNLYYFYEKNPMEIKLSKAFLSYLELQETNINKTFTGVSTSGRSKILNKAKYLYEWLRSRAGAIPKFRKYIKWQDFFGRLIQIIEETSIKRVKFEKSPNLRKNFIFLPLHYQPEASTSPLGDYYVYQDLIVEMLCSSLPENIEIFIKPHMRKGIIRKFITRLSFQDRVTFIHPSVNSLDLIKNSLAVATVTGTAGWEGFLNAKPVLMFGNYFYQDAPGVFKVSSSSEITKTISKICSEKYRNPSRVQIKAFLMAVQDLTFEGWVDNRYHSNSRISYEQNNLNLCEKIIEQLTFKKF